MTNNLKELDKAFEPFYCSSMDCNMGHLMMEDENGDAQEYGQCKCSYAIEEAKRVALALINQREKEARIDELKNLMAQHSRTFTQKVTDSSGAEYVNESYLFISKYEAQERVEQLKEELNKEVSDE